MSIKNVEQFSSRLVAALTGKALADVALQECAVFAINQSITHSNADCGIRLVEQMQESKYGNLGAMVKYLVANGNFAVVKSALVFHRYEGEATKVELEDTDKAAWKDHAKVERIEKPVDDAYIMAEVAALLKRAKAWAKSHADKAASDSTINALQQIAGTSAAVAEKPAKKTKKAAAVSAVA